MNTPYRGGFQNPGLLLLGPILFLPFIFLSLDMISVPIFIGAMVMILYLTLLVVNFEIGFMTLIFIRSSLDYLKNISAGGLNVAAVVSLVLIVLSVFYILYKRADIFKFEDTAPFLVFLAVQGVSVFYSPSFINSFSDWLRLLSVFSVYLLTRMIFVSESKIRAGLTSVLLSSLIPIFFAIIQFITKQGLVNDGGVARIVGTFIHPNAFGSYLLIILLFCMAQILEGNHFINRTFLKGLVLITGFVFLLTFSRGAWVVFIVAMLFMGIMRYRRILGLLPIGLVLAVIAVPGVKDRVMDAIDPDAQRGRSAWEWRLDTWTEIGEMVEKKPLLGHGLSTVEIEYGILTHNDYLRLLAETGVVGLMTYLFLAGFIFRKTWKDYHLSTSPIAKGFLLGLMAVMLGFMVRQLADNTLRNTVVMIYFWAFVALVRNLAVFYTRPKAPVLTEAGYAQKNSRR